MTQILMHQTEEPASPVCEKCGAWTRLVGLEPHPSEDATDLLTHVCIACDWVQTTTIARRTVNGG